MGYHVGLDWGGNGWVAVVATGSTADREFRVAFYPSMLNAWRENRDADAIVVDVPIGLPAEGTRTCDERARDVLGPNRSSVFLTPVRDAVYEDEYETASEINERATGRVLSTQSYHICPRIRELDCLLREIEPARETIREAHPEVCFAGLAGGPIAASKATEEGKKRRRAILADAVGLDRDRVRAIESRAIDDRPRYARRLRASNRDDLLDAFVLAVTATGETVSLPSEPPTDAMGLPMEIVAPADVRRFE